MSRQVSSIIIRLLKLAMFVGAVVYLFYGIHVSEFLNAMADFRLSALLPALLASCSGYLILAFRWRYLMKKEISVKAALESVFVCLSLNNLAPAKMGEVAKTVYLKTHYGLDLAKSLPLMVLERLLDLVMVALMIIPISLFYKPQGDLSLLSLLVVAGFACVLLVMVRPRWFLKLASKIKLPKVSRFLREAVKTLARIRLKEFAVLLVYSLVLWFSYYLYMFSFSQFASGFDLSPLQVLIVFVLATFGMSIPSTPGGLGIVQAGLVLALGWFGIPKEEALAFAITYHMIQYVPTTMIGLWIIYRKGFKWNVKREQKVSSK